MKRYDSYKDSGVEWIGEIPNSWSKSKFKYLTTKNVQYGVNSSSDNYTDDGIRFIRTTDIDDFGNLKPGGVFVSQNEIDESQITDYLDFLVSRSGTLGRTYLHKLDEQMTYGGYLVRFNFGKLITSKFLQYYCYSTNFWDWISLNTIVSTIGNVNGQKYNNMDVPYPPLSEQQQIVSFLDTKTSLIDSLIEKTQRKIELLKEKRTSLINEVVTKGLNPNVEMKDSGVEWIGEIPSHWIVSKFKYDSSTPVQYGINISGDKYVEEGIRFVRITDISEGGELNPNDGKYLIPEDVPKEFLLWEFDVLFCRSGHTVGKTYLHTSDGLFTSGGYLVRFNFRNYTESKFIFYISKTDFYWDWIKLNTVVSTIENVNGDKYQNFIYPKPPISRTTTNR
jgi:type I restriction enzyme, S subunit